MPTIDSAINLGLPNAPLTDDKPLFRELVPIYNALSILNQAFSDLGASTNSSGVVSIACASLTKSNTFTVGPQNFYGGINVVGSDATAASFVAITAGTIDITASSGILDYLGSTRIISRGAAGVQGTISLISTKGDGSSLLNILDTGTDGNIVIGNVALAGIRDVTIKNTDAGATSLADLKIISDAGTFQLAAESTALGAVGVVGWSGAGGLAIAASAGAITLSATAAIKVGNLVQITGSTVPAAGAGVEIAYTAGNGYVIAYDRTGAAYQAMSIGGSSFAIGINGVTKLAVTGAGIVQFSQYAAGSPTFTAGSKYLIVDASGNIQVSALGPAS